MTIDRALNHVMSSLVKTTSRASCKPQLPCTLQDQSCQCIGLLHNNIVGYVSPLTLLVITFSLIKFLSSTIFPHQATQCHCTFKFGHRSNQTGNQQITLKVYIETYST